MIYIDYPAGGYAPSVLLLHFDGNFTDSSPKANADTITGSATTTTTQKKFGSGSVNGQGAGKYVDYADAAWFDFSGDRVFSIDFRVYIDSSVSVATGHNAMFGKYGSGGQKSWAVGLTFSDVLYYYDSADGSAYQFRDITSSLSRDTWHHVSIWLLADKSLNSAVNGTIDKYYDGSTGDNQIYASTAPIRIVGGAIDYDSPFAGNLPAGVYIDELRICVDSIDYSTGNFTPPAAAYP